MPKKFPPAEPDPAIVQPSADDCPELDSSDPLFAAYRAAWNGDLARCAECLREQDYPGQSLSRLFAAAISDWRTARAVLDQSSPDVIAQLTEDLSAFRRGRGATVADCQAISRQCRLVEKELGEAKAMAAAREQAVNTVGILESYLPALFGRPASVRRFDLNGNLPVATDRVAREIGVGATTTNQWQQLAKPAETKNVPYRTVAAWSR